jgi:hypothetical protein
MLPRCPRISRSHLRVAVDPMSEARRSTFGATVVVTLLLAAITLLVTGFGTVAPDLSLAGRHHSHEQQARDALRIVFFSGLHPPARIERTTSSAASPAGAIAITLGALGASLGLVLCERGTRRGRRRWWGGRCWRAPPFAVTA